MSTAPRGQSLQVVHLDDHAGFAELPAGRLEAQREGLRVLVAETLEGAVDLVSTAEVDCLVAGVEVGDGTAGAVPAGTPLSGEGVTRDADPATTRVRSDTSPSADDADGSSATDAGRSAETIAARVREVVSDLPIVFFDRCNPGDVVEALDPATSFVPSPSEPTDATYALLANRIESLVPRRRETSVFDPLSEELGALFDSTSLPVAVFREDRVAYANESFQETFDVGPAPFRAAGVFDAVVEGEGDIRSICRPPAHGTASVALEYPDGDQHRVHVAAASDGGAVLTIWSPVAGTEIDRPSREESMLRSLLSELPISVYFKDQQSRHVRVSDALIGMSAEEYLVNGEGKRHPSAEDVVGKTDFDLYHGDHASLTVEDDRQVMETERSIGLKEEYTRSDTDEDIWLVTAKAPWYGPDGEVAGVAGVTVDVTEQKLNRREESPLDGRLDQFERVLTTTFRDELQAAIDTVDRAREGDLPGSIRDEVGAVADRLDILESLLADTMTLARYTRTPTQRTSIDFPAFLQTVWSDVDPDVGYLAVDTDQVLFADEEQLHCLLRNLFEVALQHGGAGVTVTVGDLEDGFYLERDGPPLTPEQRDALMEGRVDDAAESLGLAMTIVVGVADANGWEASVSSGGRRFEFTGVEMR